MAALKFDMVTRSLRLKTESQLPDVMREQLARYARADVARLIRSGQAAPTYSRYVNGREGVAEEAVRLPGPILYIFANWKLVVETALGALQAHSASKSGRFRSSFIVIVNGGLVTDLETIPTDAEVIITNAQPYIRKMNRGSGGRFTGTPMLFEIARKAVLQRFGQQYMAAQVRFLNLPPGLHPLIPYILKAGAGRGQGKASHRKDRQPGQPISYPSLILNRMG